MKRYIPQFSGMHNILLLGAGKSTAVLIDYLSQLCDGHNWQITVADRQTDHLADLEKSYSCIRLRTFDVLDPEGRVALIRESTLVISMLPARFHTLVAIDCLETGKDLVTASYLSKEVEELDSKARAKGVLILNEIGLDPGLDHLSAMKIIDQLKAQGADVTSFKSYTGGLVSPDDDDNIWHYKFTWNPRNVVLAGQGTALYVQQGIYKHIPYHRVFQNTEPIEVAGLGKFEGYPNRDSLRYRGVYGLQDIPTMKRGTLRIPGFCKSWDKFVQMGMTEDTYQLENAGECSFREFTNTFMEFAPDKSVDLKFAETFDIEEESDEMEKFKWLGIFSEEKLDMPGSTPAQVLQAILEKKWKLSPTDKDMIVMQHQFEYTLADKKYLLISNLVVKGDDIRQTAMAKTVGLPLGIAVKQILEGNIKMAGVHLPVSPEIYQPILAELASMGIIFHETITELEQDS